MRRADLGAKLAFSKIVGNEARGIISERVLRENKAYQIFRKTSISYFPDTLTYVCMSGGKKCSFFGKFGVLCFLVTPVLRFALLPITDVMCHIFEVFVIHLIKIL